MQNSVFCVSAVLQAMHWTVGVKTASLKLKAFDLPVDLWSAARCWSRAVGSDRKNEIMDASGWNEFPLQGAWVQTQTESERARSGCSANRLHSSGGFSGWLQVWPGTDSRTPWYPPGRSWETPPREHLTHPSPSPDTKQNTDVNDMNATKEQSGSKLSLSCYSWTEYFGFFFQPQGDINIHTQDGYCEPVSLMLICWNRHQLMATWPLLTELSAFVLVEFKRCPLFFI